MKWLELKIPPLLLTVVFIIDLAFVQWMYPESAFTFPYHQWIGGGGILIGMLICGLGIKEFRDVKTTVNPTKPETSVSLVTKGIYKYSRNPMYLGFMILLCGTVVFFANTITLMHPILFFIYMHYFQIKPEERAMLSNFGEDYLLYMTRTRRWI